MPGVKKGERVPELELIGEDGNGVSLGEITKGLVVLYFYPKDNTPGCTREAKGFNEALSELEAMGVKVFGVSKDSPNSHKKFSEKLGLKFRLLSDPGGRVASAFGADGQVYPKRTTFIIKDGVVVDVIYNVKPEEHPLKALSAIKAMEGRI